MLEGMVRRLAPGQCWMTNGDGSTDQTVDLTQDTLLGDIQDCLLWVLSPLTTGPSAVQWCT